MKKIFIINAGQIFGHSGGKFNETLANTTVDFFNGKEGYQVKTTNINDDYDPKEEVEKYVWADVIIYHTPIWWFQVPHGLKKYIDVVYTEGYNKGIYRSDGRKADNPTRNYGTGGMLQGRKYMVTSSWNAPQEAFTLPGEFFQETSVDDGILFGFHRMNAFIGLNRIDGIHFHDVMKNPAIGNEVTKYTLHLETQF